MFAFKEGTHHENVIVQIIVNTGCNKYLELGIYDGLNISKIAPHVGKAIGVDISDKRLYHNFEFIQSTTDEFFSNNKETFDIIFIDADHKFESVVSDLEKSLQILNKHGIIFLHDTDPKSAHYIQPGYCNNCYKIINYIRKNHPELDIINLPISEAGLTIVNRKNDNRHLDYVKEE